MFVSYGFDARNEMSPNQTVPGSTNQNANMLARQRTDGMVTGRDRRTMQV